MGAVVWLALTALIVAHEVRWFGDAGRERFRRLGDARAKGIHDYYVSKAPVWAYFAMLTYSTLGLVFHAIRGLWVGVVVGAATTLLILVVLLVHARSKDGILAEFAARGLAPLHERTISRKRTRRQRQFGVTALSGVVLGQVAGFVAAQANQPAWYAVGLAGTLTGLVFGVRKMSSCLRHVLSRGLYEGVR